MTARFVVVAKRPWAPANHSGNSKIAEHPRQIGWLGTTALAMGGSNQSLFLLGALFAGQGDIPGQGSAAVPLLIVGLLLSYAAAPGWLELVLMSPGRIGGIAACCTAAFRRYSPILSTLTGACYWWGWIPTCGVTAILSASAISQWVLPQVPVTAIACALVALFVVVNMLGIGCVTRVAIPVAAASAGLAFVSMIAPLAAGTVDWRQAVSFHLTTPFPGRFGEITSLMAGLYLVGFGAPAFEAALCHVGKTVDPGRNVPRAMFASAAMAAVYFAFLPAIWLGALGSEALGQDLARVLGPTFAPLLGSLGKSAAIGFMMFNMFHGTLQPLAGAARTLAQLSDDGMAPRCFGVRTSRDVPWAATLLTAGFAVVFLLIGDPIWLIAAANFTYLIGIGMPSIAVWLLRRDQPDAARPYRAPRGTIALGVAAALAWMCSALLGFQQFGLPTVVIGLCMAYGGTAFYAWRKIEDRRRRGQPGFTPSLHVKLTGAMLLVLALDAAGYFIAVTRITDDADARVVTALADIFVAVALLTISVGIVLPGIIAHSADQVGEAARRLARGTIRDFVLAMDALGRGRLADAHARFDIVPVAVTSRDELGVMAKCFNELQAGVGRAARGLDRARAGLSAARSELVTVNDTLCATVREQHRLAEELTRAKESALYQARHDHLTGLPNRVLLLERLHDALVRGRAAEGCDHAALFLDLDRFKIVNDSLGHLAGDRLLIQVAARLAAAIRERERPAGRCGACPAEDLLARLSGDEFTLLAAHATGPDDAAGLGTRIQEALAAPFAIDDERIYVTASIGVVPSIARYESTETILRDADMAMYRAKLDGASRFALYEPGMHRVATTALHLENDLRRAVDRQEFVLHYQPIVTIAGGSLVGVEALIRWQAPGMGLVPPDRFIAAAEATGLIVPIGGWALRDACLTVSRWRLETEWDRLALAVNLSARQFLRAELAPEIAAILDATRTDPATLTLEITESCAMGDPERAMRVLRDLKAIGLRLSVDDFGTGHSSLSYLHRFPVDELKIDRSFIRDLVAQPESAQIVGTMIGLAHRLGLRVVAEGVETPEQLAMLRELGCDLAQGFHLASPMAAADMAVALGARYARAPVRDHTRDQVRDQMRDPGLGGFARAVAG